MKEDMFVFAVLVTPSSSSQELGVQLPQKYVEFSDVFDKVKTNKLPAHRSYDCPIDLNPRKEPPRGQSITFPPQNWKFF